MDEVKTVRTEAAALTAHGVDIIIVLSHCGLERDLEVAKDAGPDVDIIVGGHSHSFMYTGSHPPGTKPAQALYPSVVKQSNGHQVLVVQASAYAQYVGDLVVWFDDHGEVSSWKGNPVFLNKSIPKGNLIQNTNMLAHLYIRCCLLR